MLSSCISNDINRSFRLACDLFILRRNLVSLSKHQQYYQGKAVNNYTNAFSLCMKSYVRTKSGSQSRINGSRIPQSSALDILDTHSIPKSADEDNNNINRKHKNKLSQGLEPTETKKLTDRAQGTADVLCDDITASINDTLGDDRLYGLFDGFKTASDVIDIDRCEANLDFSDVIVYWRSSIVAKILRVTKAKHPEEVAMQLNSKIINGITKKLQIKEPIFRSKLLKDVYFKKVPKLIFRSCHDVKKRPQLDPEVVRRIMKEDS